MPWELNGTALLGLVAGAARLTYRSQGIDELELAKVGTCDVPAVPVDTWCELADPDGAIVFQGEAKLTQGEAEGGPEKNIVRILGPWADLERLTWRSGSDVRLNFPADPESLTAVSLDAAVETVLTGAIALGARFTIGSVDLDGEIPAVQFDNTTCAAILVALLRWSPGAVTWFDYDTGGLPALHIIAAANLTPFSLTAAGCKGLRVAPRTDFRVPGVRLVFRKKIQTTYGEAEGTELDASGTPDAIGGFVSALDLNPARAQFSLQKNRLIVSAAAADSGDWWRALGATSTGDPVTDSATGDVSLTHYVTAGQLENWMLNEIDGVANTDPYGCEGPLASTPAAPPTAGQAFAGTEPPLHTTNAQSYKVAKRKFTASFADGRTWTIELPMTSLATSGTYYRETLTAWDPGEVVPTGLAAALYAAVSRLAYSGSFHLVQDECTPLTHLPGLAFSISDTAWSTMAAPIHAVGHDIAAGRTEMEFGPSEYLGAADLLELFRASKAKKAAQAALEPEEDPAPVTYSAVATSASEPSPEDAETGTLTVAITPPGEDSDFDEDEVYWTAHGPETFQGAGPGAIEVPAGDYTVVFHPVFSIAGGVMFWPVTGQVEVNIPVGSGATATGSYDAVQRMFVKATGQDDPTGGDLNAQDLVDLGLPTAGAKLVKFRVLDVCHMGAAGKRVFFCGESYEEV
jgi:hypothetical protein